MAKATQKKLPVQTSKQTCFATVAEMVKKTHSATFWKFWQAHHRSEARLLAKYAKDTTHQHTRAECGSIGPVEEGPTETVLFWCSICHAEMGYEVRKIT